MEKDNVKIHESVLVSEILTVFGLNAPLKKQVHFVDATLGTGGHTLALLKAKAKVIGIDYDPQMIKLARERLVSENIPEENYQLISGNFNDLEKIIHSTKVKKIEGILFDLGVSNLHLKDGVRGFSFGNPLAKLDMRLNPKKEAVTGAMLLNALRKDQLIFLFSKVLAYFEAKKLTLAILYFRQKKAFETVGDFLEVCNVVKPKNGLSQATLPFLALRIAVNSELENISQALPQALTLLGSKGKLAIVTFHSGEEKVILDFIFQKEKEGEILNLTPQPIRPKIKEIMTNPKARSAKLWVVEKK